MTATVINFNNHGQHVRHKEYVKAGNWRCADSPTKAHHWLVSDDGSSECRHCGERKAKRVEGGIW